MNKLLWTKYIRMGGLRQSCFHFFGGGGGGDNSAKENISKQAFGCGASGHNWKERKGNKGKPL